jgi:hypothetical protein
VFDGQSEVRVKCSRCGKEHELLEPSFRRPDIVAEMSTEQKQRRVEKDGDDLCIVRAGDGDEVRRYFLRAVLPVRITDRGEDTRWGLWVEVPEANARRAWDLWNSPAQNHEPAFAGCIANRIPGYLDTIGLLVEVQLTGPTTRPRALFASTVDHPFAVDCRAGVTTHTVLAWLAGQGGAAQ